MNKLSQLTEEHIEYIRKIQAKPNDILATQVNDMFNTNLSDRDIEEVRHQLGLNPPDPERSLAQSMRLEQRRIPTHRGMKDTKPLSAAQIKNSGKPKPPKKAVQDNFTGAAETVSEVSVPVIAIEPDELDKLLAEKRSTTNFKFTPVLVKNAEKGEVYIYPDNGLVVCEGIETTVAAGAKLEVILFNKLHAGGQKNLLRVINSEERLKRNLIRELASEETMNAALYKLRHGSGMIKNLPKLWNHKKVLYDAMISSADVAAVTNLVGHLVGSDRTQRLPDFQRDIVQNGLHMLASEYSAIKGIALWDAQRLFERALYEAPPVPNTNNPDAQPVSGATPEGGPVAP